MHTCMLFICKPTVKDGECAVYINLFYETNSPTNSSELTLSRSPLRVLRYQRGFLINSRDLSKILLGMPLH